MADIYLSSVDGNDSDDGLTWANAKATFSSAQAAAGAGGRIFVDSAHAQTQASALTLSSSGTVGNRLKVYSVDRTGNPEPPTTLLAGASISTTNNNAISIQGFMHFEGITFNAGSGISGGTMLNLATTNDVNHHLTFKNCQLGTLNTASGSIFLLGTLSGGSNRCPVVEFINTNWRAGHVSQVWTIRGTLIWHGGSVITVAPTTLFTSSTSFPFNVMLRGVDLSIMGSGKTIASTGASINGLFELRNCKLGSSVAIKAGTIANPFGIRTRLVNCDSADTNYRYYLDDYAGEIFSESTIVRTGGATISRKMVSNASVQFHTPLVSDWMAIPNTTVGSAVVLTAEVITDNVTLDDDEAWLEVEYLGTSGFPLALLADDRLADPLGTPANQTSSSETWTTTGLTTPVKQKLSVSVTPQEVGWILCRVHLARASTTMYFDPQIEVS